MRVNRLKNYYRKYKANYINQETLDDVLDEAIETLREYSKTLDQNRTQLRRFESNNIEKFEGHLFGAIKNLKHRKYEAAILEIKKGKQVRAELKTAVAVIGHYNQARILLNRIKRDIDQHWLKQLTSVKILEGQIGKIERALKEHKYMQARVIANYCIGEMKELHEINEASWEKEITPIKERIDGFKKICKDTHLLSLSYPAEQIAIEGKVERLLIYLLDQKNTKLVDRLLDDIGGIMEDRIRFNEVYSAKLNTTSIDEDFLKRAIEKGGWIGGTNYILSQEIGQIKVSLNVISI